MSDDERPVRVTVDARLAERIPGFLERRRHDVVALLQACRLCDFVAIESIGHDMAGIGGAYGFDAITAMGRDLEQAARAADCRAARTTAVALAKYLARVQIRYRRRPVTLPGVPARPVRATGR